MKPSQSRAQQFPKPQDAGSSPAVSARAVKRLLEDNFADPDLAIAALELTRPEVDSEVDTIPAWDEDGPVHTGVMFSDRYGRSWDKGPRGLPTPRERGIVKLTFSFDENESGCTVDAELVTIHWDHMTRVVRVDHNVTPTAVEMLSVSEAVESMRRDLEARAAEYHHPDVCLGGRMYSSADLDHADREIDRMGDDR